MNFDFTEEQQLFADSVRRFALAHLEKDSLQRAHDPHFPFDRGEADGGAGAMGITLPEADGGQGGALMDAVIAIEQVAAVCPAQRRRRAVRQSRADPHVRGVCDPGAEARWLPALLSGGMVMKPRDERGPTGLGRLLSSRPARGRTARITS